MEANMQLLQSASKQALCEVLGYDEGSLYYLLLDKDSQGIERNFSYSKRYRIMRKLYEIGVMIKVNNSQNESYSYTVMPPLFLRGKKVAQEIISYLEGLYRKNFLSTFQRGIKKFICKNDNLFINYLIKYIMNEKIEMNVDERFKFKLHRNNNKNITINHKEGIARSFGVIDGVTIFNISRVEFGNDQECYGYINTQGHTNEILKLEKELVNKQIESTIGRNK
jgi:hypothetical protein